MSSIQQQLLEKRAAAKLGGGEKRIEAQHAKGKLTARERLQVLFELAVDALSVCRGGREEGH